MLFNLKIRKAEINDLEETLQQIKVYFDEIKKDHFDREWNHEESKSLVENYIKDPNYCVFLAVGKNIQGVIIACLMKPILGKGNNCVEIVWHSNPKLNKFKRYLIIMKLFQKLESWAKEKKAKAILISSKNNNSIYKYLLKQNFKESETIYKKAVT